MARGGPALGGVGGVALIAGEAGLGKTRLVDEIAVEARARGMFVVRGQCYDMEGAPPYVPFVEAIEYALNVVPRDTFRAAMGEAGPEIARFVPKVRVAYPDLPPPVALPTDQAHHYMLESVCDFFERSAAIQPMLMVLEDLHWADESTSQLLESVARRVERAALLVLGTYRDVDLGPRDPFMRGIEHLSRLATVSRITLKRLSAGEVGDILRALSGREPPERLARLVYAETEGCPSSSRSTDTWPRSAASRMRQGTGFPRPRLARSRCQKRSGSCSAGVSTASARQRSAS
jgi:predicted ATPase